GSQTDRSVHEGALAVHPSVERDRSGGGQPDRLAQQRRARAGAFRGRAQDAGVLEEREEQMLHRVFGFADLTAGQVMVPRTELVAIAADAPREMLYEQMGRAGYPTLPVYRTDLDDVIGILHVTDVMKALASGQSDLTPATLARETLTVPETISADDLLAEMRRRGVREAIVIDEYGGTAGLVTFE